MWLKLYWNVLGGPNLVLSLSKKEKIPMEITFFWHLTIEFLQRIINPFFLLLFLFTYSLLLTLSFSDSTSANIIKINLYGK